MTVINEANIQNKLLLRSHGRSRVVIPNYTPPNWWECDLAAFSKSGYLTEYEIKLTVSDFKNDARKRKSLGYDKIRNNSRSGVKYSKHELLGSRDVKAPKKFTFVTPEGLLTEDDIPEWAGWMEATIYTNSAGITSVGIVSRKVAPINKNSLKYPVEVTDKASKCFYYRYWKLRGVNL